MDILSERGLKRVAFSMDQNHKLTIVRDQAYNDNSCHRRLVGCLVYLTITCLEISFAFHSLSQFLQHPLL